MENAAAGQSGSAHAWRLLSGHGMDIIMNRTLQNEQQEAALRQQCYDYCAKVATGFVSLLQGMGVTIGYFVNPKKIVTVYINAFDAVSASFSVTPLTLIKLPNISIPISGAVAGRISITKIVTIMGNNTFSFCDTGLN